MTRIITENNIAQKVPVIPSTDVGTSWVLNFAEPLNIRIINEYTKDISFDIMYEYKTKTLHN